MKRKEAEREIAQLRIALLNEVSYSAMLLTRLDEVKARSDEWQQLAVNLGHRAEARFDLNMRCLEVRVRLAEAVLVLARDGVEQPIQYACANAAKEMLKVFEERNNPA